MLSSHFIKGFLLTGIPATAVSVFSALFIFNLLRRLGFYGHLVDSFGHFDCHIDYRSKKTIFPAKGRE
jgi:hypothetical protein